MVKAKAKADRAAVRLAAHQAHVAAQALVGGNHHLLLWCLPSIAKHLLQRAPTYRPGKLMKLVIIWRWRRPRLKLFLIVYQLAPLTYHRTNLPAWLVGPYQLCAKIHIYSIYLDQAVKTLSEVWRIQDISAAFLPPPSQSATAAIKSLSQKHPCFHK